MAQYERDFVQMRSVFTEKYAWLIGKKNNIKSVGTWI